MPVPLLPVELWLAIFCWATISSSTPHLFATAYHPFQPDTLDGVDREVIAVKRTLVRVCKQWRRVATDLLLEDVVIHQDINQLARALKAGGGEDSRFRRVRRVCLPYFSCISYKPELAGITSILSLCRELEVLVRPPPSWTKELRFEFPADDCPPLPSLKRLDWWHHNDATGSGGINSLIDVARAAPNLQYLSLGGELCLSALQRAAVSLPCLSTLRIRRMNVLLLLQVQKWRMPSLQHVIIDTNNHQILEDFWATFGRQMKIVELGQTMESHASNIIHDVLTQCPNLEGLNYHVQFAAVPYPLQQHHSKLSLVRLNAARNPFFANESNGLWEHLESHFSALCSPDFPALKRVAFQGDWGCFQDNDCFGEMVAKMRAAGREIETERSE